LSLCFFSQFFLLPLLYCCISFLSLFCSVEICCCYCCIILSSSSTSSLCLFGEFCCSYHCIFCPFLFLSCFSLAFLL
jgi:hypothetical protein